MNIKIGFMIVLYYSIFSLIFLVSGSTFTQAAGYNNTIDLNDSEMSSGELEQGGFFSVGVSFARFVGFVGFGLGLPSDTPEWFDLVFFGWQTIITILSVMFVISSIWDG